MKTYKTINGFYGSNHTPCDVFIAENRDGSTWYVVEGGTMVNLTYDKVTYRVDVEELGDVDVFTWNKAIESIEEFEEAVES